MERNWCATFLRRNWASEFNEIKNEIKGQVICKIPPNNQMLVQKSVASQSGPGGGSREAQGSEVAASDPSY
jgi:hypothetical protein